jgi:hypothetical protein
VFEKARGSLREAEEVLSVALEFTVEGVASRLLPRIDTWKASFSAAGHDCRVVVRDMIVELCTGGGKLLDRERFESVIRGAPSFPRQPGMGDDGQLCTSEDGRFATAAPAAVDAAWEVYREAAGGVTAGALRARLGRSGVHTRHVLVDIQVSDIFSLSASSCVQPSLV